MRILVVNWQDRTNPLAGGAEVHLHEIFGRVAAAGHEVHLLCSGYRGARATDEVDGMRVHRVGSRYGFALAGRRAFRRLAGELAPDVVVEDVNKVPLNLPRAWPGPFVLLVPHLFGTTALRELPAPLGAVVWLAERPMPRVYARAGIHAISESTRQDLVARGFRPSAIRVILPGVDTARFAPDPSVPREREPTFLYVGRLKRYKQVDTAIHALRVLRDGARARLWIAGTGDDRPRLERLARRAGVADAVTFLGWVGEERKLELYRRAWAVVLPSLKEGWGITNIEAAACGTPAVAADNSALRESVRDSESGYLVPTGEPDAWAAALGRLAADPGPLRERLSRGARAFAEPFSWTRTASDTRSHLEAVAAGWPRGQERRDADEAHDPSR